jgi:cobalt-zinc-cadmium efflux system membrane fusion protein
MTRTDTKFYLIILLALALGSGHLACSRDHGPQGRSGDEAAPGDAARYGRQGSPARSPVSGRGRGGPGLGLGRGGGRGWDPSTVIRLDEKESAAVEFETAPVAYRPMSSTLQVTGKVFAHQMRQAIVSYPFPARVATIHVRPGDWVEPGRPLVTLQSEAVGEAKADYFKAMADLELARSNHEREKRLFERGAGAGKNLQSAEAELKVAAAVLDAAEKKLHILGFSEEMVGRAGETHEINPQITLFAPIAGTVVENSLVVGGMVDQASGILTLLDPRTLCVDADVYERDIAKVHKGQDVEITVPAFPGLKFLGKIQYIGDVLKEETRTVTVRTEVENKGLRLKPGMFASLRIVLDEQSRALVVPDSAVLDDGNEKILFVKKDDVFHPRVVTLGSKINGFLEVLQGVAEGDQVVTSGGYQLKSKLYDEILKAAGIH